MLIIYAHPNKNGHCGYILQQVQKELENKKISFQILDLYQENYNPVLKPEEHYTSGHKNISEDTIRYQKMLVKNDKFIIIYPTWWNGVPAILKGFFDRTLTSGFAYRYINGIPRGLLKGRALVFTTTGAPEIIERIVLGSRSLKMVTSDTLRFCGIKARGIIIGRALRLTDETKKKIESKVTSALNYVI